MGDCGCEKAKRDLEEYLHHELARAEYADIAEHLASCPECAAEHHVGIALMEAVRRACHDTAPEELRAQVIERLRIAVRH